MRDGCRPGIFFDTHTYLPAKRNPAAQSMLRGSGNGPALAGSSAPAVGVAHFDHLGEDGVPGLLGLEDRIREHAAIPADVLDAAGGSVLEPVAGALHDVELAIRIVRLAVLARLVMRAGAV